MIHVAATVEVRPGERDAVLADLAGLAPKIKAEEGCLEYLVATEIPTKLPAQAPPRDNVIVTLERWRTLKDSEAHLRAPHMVKFVERNLDRIVKATLQILKSQ